jgi:hypothetical protein
MLVTPDKARLILTALDGAPLHPIGQDEEADLAELRAELEHAANVPTISRDAAVGHVGGHGDGRGPGITPFDPGYRTVLLDGLGAVAMHVQPGNELAVYLELTGRLNKRRERDEAAYLMRPGQAAELIADLVVAGQAGGPVIAQELEGAIAREQARRGMERPA